MLLHFLHLLLDGRVQLALKFQRLHVVHVSVAVEEIALKRRSGAFLGVARRFRVVFVVAIAAVPARTVRLPHAQAHPAKLGLAGLVLAHHVVAAAVLLDGELALGALLGVGRYPVGRLRVIVALFYPLAQEVTLYRFVPVLATVEAKRVVAFAGHWSALDVLDLYRVVAVGRWTPPQ